MYTCLLLFDLIDGNFLRKKGFGQRGLTMEDVVNRRVSTEATSWNRRTEAAPLRRAPLLLTFICFSSPASRLTLITLSALGEIT